jgi:acetyl-CoA synthetase
MLQASNPEDIQWLMSRTGYKAVLEYCGGTEIGGAFCGGTLLHPCIPSLFATCNLGMDLLLLSSDGGVQGSMTTRQAARGEVAVLAPAMGTSHMLLNGDHFEVYFSGMPRGRFAQGVDMPLRRHGDEFEVLPGLGFFRAHGRCDDTMNLGGIKVLLLYCSAKMGLGYGTSG